MASGISSTGSGFEDSEFQVRLSEVRVKGHVSGI